MVPGVPAPRTSSELSMGPGCGAGDRREAGASVAAECGTGSETEHGEGLRGRNVCQIHPVVAVVVVVAVGDVAEVGCVSHLALYIIPKHPGGRPAVTKAGQDQLDPATSKKTCGGDGKSRSC